MDVKQSSMRALPDLLAMTAGLSAAWLLGWNTTDLIWSLWLSSLVLGYASIFSAILGGFYFATALQPVDGCISRRGWLVVASVLALLVLTFFSIHFCGAHAIQAGALMQFFPLEGVEPSEFLTGFMNAPLLLYNAAVYLFPGYGVFVLPALIVERKHIFSGFIRAYRLRNGLEPSPTKQQTGKAPSASPVSELFIRPYKNVFRLHLLLFVFAICHFLEVTSFVVFAIVYLAYFFPWHLLRAASWYKSAAGRVGGTTAPPG